MKPFLINGQKLSANDEPLYFWKEGNEFKYSKQQKDLPDACFVLKHSPRKAIETLNWPDLSEIKFVEEQ